ncbi:MAG: dihydrofolate reductase family protein [Paludibacteraceae bacterium]
MGNRKLVLYIASSLDGFIAKPNDDLSFLGLVKKEGEDYGYEDFISTVDTVILGRKTYDWVTKNAPEFPHNDKETYVITRSTTEKKGNITFYNGSLIDLILLLKSKNGKNIFCDGGAEIVNELFKYKLMDEMVLSIIPIMVGNGKKLFHLDIPEQELTLLSAKSFDTGLVQLHYKVKNICTPKTN